MLMLPGCGRDEVSSAPAASSSVTSQAEDVEGIIGENAFIITLYPNFAPITCQNFQNLVSSGFYDGLTFHRVVDNFMAQGGDPAGNGTGGSEKTIKGEFSANGVQNNLSHQRGIVSMARSQSLDSASSQFFICFNDVSYSLDGKYAAFGEVTEGMNVVDSFTTVERKMNSMGETAIPIKPLVMQKVKMYDNDDKGNPRVMVIMKDFPLK